MATQGLTTLARFETKFLRLGAAECWPWQAGRDKDGYGAFYLGTNNVRAHSASWRLYRGDIPDGMWVLHKCDNPPCVNPDHLFIGTPLDNVTDMIIKGRRRVMIGDQRFNTKLSASDIPVIRQLLMKVNSISAIADEYGVTRGAIGSIKYGNSWNHIPLTSPKIT